ncbi:hypothetical protein BN1708_007643 [Verticillium longisporum]|uniref:Uncharacterized protein n=1 Tax=Verticillium longisporum TaxID=100787 RepID=A0A0G4MV21_VERLO|nr:hypothetical protein BN1708_007643 [Verticillium longisporum]
MVAPANEPPALKGADPIIHNANWVLWQQVLESAKAVCLGSTTSQYGPPTQQDQEAPASEGDAQVLVLDEVNRLVAPDNVYRRRAPGLEWRSKVECEGSKALVFFGVLREHILLFVDLCQPSLGANTGSPDLFNDTAMDYGDEPSTNQKREGNTSKNRLARLQAQIHHHDASFAPGCEPYNEYFTDAIDYLTTTLVDVLPEPADDYRMKPILIALVARLAARLKQMNRHLRLPPPGLQKKPSIAQFCRDLIPLPCWDWLGARIRERLAVSQTFEDDSSAVDDMSNWSNEKRRKIFETAQDKYNTWVVDENSIVVPYKQYAWSFLGIAATLVIGGLAFGFSIGERIQGVDPFNISVFCWGLAAFMLVLVKAVRVEYWSWHRFLRGEVACRSITEVVSVTGMNPQVLLVILLRLDDRMFLQTRGPFNTMFRRHTDDPQSGFSINVPIKATTAFEGGLIPVIVQGEQDLGLVLLRANSWATFNSVKNRQTFENGLHCRDIQHSGSWAPDKSVPCYRLSRGDMKVVRVLDVYGRDSYLY